jgi:TrpR family trp operon transcriptional repressor
MNPHSKISDWQQFLKLCKQLQTEQQLNEFFDLFLTIEERNAIKDRCILIRELLKGEKTQREIAADFNISIAKISRGSNYLKTISNDLRKFLAKQLL